MKTNSLIALAGCIAATLFLSDATWAQITADVDETTGQDLPTADQVIADYLKATGGLENHQAVKSLISNASINILVENPQSPGEMLEFPGELKMKQMAPNRLILETRVPQLGNQQTQGYDGKTAWLMSNQEPALILEGDRLKMTKLQADMNQYLHMSDHFDQVECTGEENFYDEPCYVISATNNDGSVPMTVYFSKRTQLLVGSKFSMKSPSADLEIENRIMDYRSVGDVKMSFKSVSKNQLFTQVFTIEEIKVNQEIDESSFDLPEEIQALLDKQ